MAMSMLHQTIMLSERQHFKQRHVTSPPSPSNQRRARADGSSSSAHAMAAAAYMRRPSNCMRPPPISRNKSAPATPLSRSATVSEQLPTFGRH